MNLMRTTKPSFNRRALETQAMQAAISTRAKAKLDQAGPICIYGLCETLGVAVRFNQINMEGMYQRGAPSRIHLSARRPLARRVYNAPTSWATMSSGTVRPSTNCAKTPKNIPGKIPRSSWPTPSPGLR